MNLSDIQTIIEKAVPNATVRIRDPLNDGQHLEAIVISPAFEGMPLVKQHQMVMGALKAALATSVHAMALKTFTPAKWELIKNNIE